MPGDGGNSETLEEGGEGLPGTPVARRLEGLLHHEALKAGPLCLLVLGIDTDVPDLGVGHGDQLPGVGGIGEDLLITGQAGVEADLADADPFTTETVAAVDGPIREREMRGTRGEFPRDHGARTPRSRS